MNLKWDLEVCFSLYDFSIGSFFECRPGERLNDTTKYLIQWTEQIFLPLGDLKIWYN